VYRRKYGLLIITYLALGDSYTIGENLPLKDNFPNQTVQILSAAGFSLKPPHIIAKTGWTSGELRSAIANNKLDDRYDIVSLLVGVNNQYRGKDISVYTKEFEELLQLSIELAGKNPARVFVLSIPDWGVTPFAGGRDRKRISSEIDSFNLINKNLSLKWNVNYIDITPGTREAASNSSLVAADGLHPSAIEYNRWGKMLAEAIQQTLR
jgi:lysophospholipase L1-like esterase